MKKPAGRKKAVSAKRAAPERSASLKKPGLRKTEEAEKKVKPEPPARTASAVKKAKTVAKPPAKSAKITKKPSRAKKAGKERVKTAGKSSAAAAKTSPRPAARKTAPTKTTAKITPKKTVPQAVGKKVIRKKRAKSAEISSATAAKTSIRPAARKTVPTKTAAKTTRKKPVKKTADRLPEAAKKPPKKTVPEATEESAVRISDVETAKIIAPGELPQEYGENEVIVMPVDPHVIFVDWEIRKEEIPSEDSIITMRVFDATTGYMDSESLAGRFLELRLEDRIGSGFFDIGRPGRDVAIEIGLDYNGTFLPILESPTVSMPEIVAFDELGIAQKLLESGVPVGY